MTLLFSNTRARIAAAVVAFCVAPWAIGGEVDVQTVVRETRPAVLLLVVENDKGESLWTGTGFFISEDGKIVTNYHVAEGGARIVAKSENGAFYLVEKIVQADPKSDLAILQTTAKHAAFLKLGKADEADVGSTVIVLGSPLGLEGTVSTGVLSAVRVVNGVQKIQISAPISHGSSGSPVVNGSGQVIGIVSSSSVKGQNLNFAIATVALQELLARPAGQVSVLLGQTSQGGGPAGARPLLSDPRYNAAIRLLNENDAVSALKVFNQLAAEYPNENALHFHLARTYSKMGFRQDTIEEYHKAIKLLPDDAASWTNLSMEYTFAGEYPLARDAGERAIKIDPTDPVAWRARGIYLLFTKQPSAAIEAIQRSIKLGPGDAVTWNLLSTAYQRAGMTQNALEAEKQANALKGAKPPATPALQPVDPNRKSVTSVVVGVAAGDNLKVRSAPSMSSTPALTLMNGDRVEVIGEPVLNGKTEWVPVSQGATHGWVRSKYLRPE